MDPDLSALPVRADQAEASAGQPFDWDSDDRQLLEQVVSFFRSRLSTTQAPSAFLRRRGLALERLRETFELGFSDRELGRRLPAKQLVQGRTCRDRLTRLGVLRASGHGHFVGSLVVPIRSLEGCLADLYGRKVGANLAKGTRLHSYLPAAARPRGSERGVFNGPALQSSAGELILTDGVLNALSFWSVGLTQVTCTLEDEPPSGQLWQLLSAEQVQRVILAFRASPSGERLAEQVARRLLEVRKEVAQVRFAEGEDANDVLRARGNLKKLVAKARLIVKPAPLPAKGTPAAKEQQVKTAGRTDSRRAAELEIHETDVTISFDDRRYRVRGLEKNHSYDRLKVNLMVERDGLLHVDTLDLYHARTRRTFIKQASDEIYRDEETIKSDLAQLLLKLEQLQETQIQSQLSLTPPEPIRLTPAEQDEALSLLTAPDLTERIVTDFERCGLVGEANNKLLCYLACVSRRLPRPLAVLIQSSSAAGKTTLMDAALSLMPPEEQVRYSAMTGQSLYYLGQKHLQHKILAIAEEEGVAQASYALKLLQSEGRLTLVTAGKDADTGRPQSHEYQVEGPVMMFLTTTSETPDTELQNRCLTLRVNESAQQTEAIHALQRSHYTLSGREAIDQRDQVTRLHQNAQRLLEPYPVLIPWAGQLTFRSDQVRMRRDHEKYLSLIASITLLHQHRRERQTTRQGVAHLVATQPDIALANRLASEVLGQSLDELLPQTRQLLVLWHDHIQQRAREQKLDRAGVRLTQRELREATGWGDFQLRRHLSRLVELEYVLVHRTGRGNQRTYQLLYDGQGQDGKRFLLGLIDLDRLLVLE